jgi:hypothetical protein
MNLAKITVVYRLIPSRATSVECVLKSSRAREVPVLGLLLARAKKHPGYSIPRRAISAVGNHLELLEPHRHTGE